MTGQELINEITKAIFWRYSEETEYTQQTKQMLIQYKMFLQTGAINLNEKIENQIMNQVTNLRFYYANLFADKRELNNDLDFSAMKSI